LPLLTVLLEPSSSLAIDAGRPLSQVQVDVWQMEDGLPQNTVTSILRTRDGHLWFGTYDGLVRFDGAQFTSFDGRTTPLLAAGSTFALMEDRNGALWIGRSENVLVYRDGVFREVLGAEELGQGTVWSLCEAPDGTVWGGAGKGLVRWKDGLATLFGRLQDLPSVRFRSVCVDRDGTLWIGTNGGGLISMRDGEFSVRSTKNGFPSDEVVTVLPDPAGGVWVATAGSGLVRVVGGTHRVYGTEQGLPTGQTTALAFDPAGSLWVGTWGKGVCRLRNDTFSCLGPLALSNDKIWSLFADSEGFIWVGTWVGGLNRLRDRSFPVYGVPEGLSNENVRAVLHGRDGSVWLATAGGGLNRIREGRVEVLRKTDGLPSDEVSALCEDRSGALWVGTFTSGLARIHGKRIETFGKAEGLPGLDVRVILEDRQGTIWAATTAGVARSRDGRRFERLETPEWVALNAVACALEDRSGAYWFGTSGDGLVRYDATGFRVLTTRDGLLSDRISALHEDEEAVLWIGTAWSGCNRLKGGRIDAIRPEDGLAEGRVQVILEDRSGGVWFTGNRGFQRVLKKELNAVADRRLAVLRPLAFGLADGLRSVSFASGQRPAGSIGPDGRLWLPSYRGVVVVDPERLPPHPEAPTVRLEELLVDQVSRGASKQVEIGPGRQNVELRFSPLTLQPSERFGFRFRLDGFDSAWREVGSRRSAFYTGLPPGRYRFSVECRIADRPWGPRTELASIVVRPALYERWWVRLFALALGLGGIAFAFRRQRLRADRRLEDSERLLRERTSDLRRANERQAELSSVDPLTGLSNRRHLDETYEAEWKRAVHLAHPISLVLVDLGGLGSTHDALVHAAAGRDLAAVAKVIQSNARRPGDLAARLGGGEFALLLPGASLFEALEVAETTRAEIAALGIPQAGGATRYLTASLGVATVLPGPDGDPARLFHEAEAALRRARAAGPNRVEPTTAHPGAERVAGSAGTPSGGRKG
jgi:diguanylate cyclase (GGDEF)-like protein